MNVAVASSSRNVMSRVPVSDKVITLTIYMHGTILKIAAVCFVVIRTLKHGTIAVGDMHTASSCSEHRGGML